MNNSIRSYDYYLKIFNNFKIYSNKDFVFEIDSWINWPITSVVWLTHWNEISWLILFDYLINEFDIRKKIKKWKINLIIWNFKAFLTKTQDWLLCRRYLEKDFNRVWWEDWEKYEYKRKNEIKKYIDESNALIDIHTTSNPSTPMIFPVNNNKLSNEIVEKFIWEFVIHNILDKLNWVCLADYHWKQNKNNISIAFEWWEHFDNKTIENVKYNILMFLNKMWNISENIYTSEKYIKKNLYVYHVEKAKSLDYKFTYSHTPKSFDFIKKWVQISLDWEEKIYCNNDSYILMPAKKIYYIWEEAFYLSKEK